MHTTAQARGKVADAAPSGVKGKPGERYSGISWMALLAGATLGADTVVALRAEVRGGVDLMVPVEEAYRLVVQSYARGAWSPGSVPGCGVRPLGAVQRAVSRNELRAGIRVEILQVGVEEVVESGSVLVAWVEPGAADLAYDGLSARPGPRAIVAVSAVGSGASGGTQLVVGGTRAAA